MSTLPILQVKSAYVNFLTHCYIDTEVEMKEIYTSNHMWNLIDSFIVDMKNVSVCVYFDKAETFLFDTNFLMLANNILLIHIFVV